MEFSFLYAIPRTEVLDSFFLGLTRVAGSYGQLWLISAALLLIFKGTRKAGVSVLIAYLAVFLIGQLALKNLFSRPRPCQIDEAFALLVARPSSSSFPMRAFSSSSCFFRISSFNSLYFSAACVDLRD